MNFAYADNKEFIRKLAEIVHNNLDNENFGVDDLVKETGLSSSMVRRRLKEISRRNINQFINEVRLQKALELLQHGMDTASEVSYKVGFRSPAYFTKSFHNYFGYTPGEVRRKAARDQENSVNLSEPQEIFEPTPERKLPEGNKIQHVVPDGDMGNTLRPFVLNFRVIFYSALGIVAVLFIVYSLFPRLGQRSTQEPAFPENSDQSIAVLPVANLTGNPDFDYIAEGILTSLTDELYRLGNLQVRPAPAALKFTGSPLSPSAIAGKLKADLYLKPSLMCSGDSFCISVQLYQSTPEVKLLWSSSFVKEKKDVLMIFRTSAYEIAKIVNVPLTTREQNYLTSKKRVNPDFFNALMLGKHYIRKTTPADFSRGVAELKKAIDINPLDPAPYLALAAGYSNAGHASKAGSDASEMARAYAQKALQLDSTLAEAHAMLAAWYLYRDWNWGKTEYHLNKAIAINPDIPLARYTNSWYLSLNGYSEESIKEMKKAVEIDPLDPVCINFLAWLYDYFGMWEEAIEAADRAIEVEPVNPVPFFVKGECYTHLGQFDKAIAEHEKGIAIRPDFKYALGYTYALAGQRDKALKIAAELENDPNPWNAFALTILYSGLEDKDKTLYWLETLYNQRMDYVPWSKKNLAYSFLYDDPRFQAIINRLNLPS